MAKAMNLAIWRPPGKLADIILVDLSGAHHLPLNSVSASLVYNVRAGDVQTVICDGQIIMQEREHQRLDKDEIMENIRRGWRDCGNATAPPRYRPTTLDGGTTTTPSPQPPSPASWRRGAR